MAEIAPFNGIRYNKAKVGDLTAVVTPPYDVISPEAQQAFYERHPNNVVRLDFNRETENDTAGNNRYTRAASFFGQWCADGTLQRDEAPAFYITTVSFPLEGKEVVRHGLTVLVRLEPFEKRVVLPHEKTFSKVKTDRLDLMKACHANFSPIFTLFPDRENVLSLVQGAVAGKPAEMDITDDDGVRHRMWPVVDPDLHNRIATELRDKQFFIADGHHRYETALNYREWVSRNDPTFDDTHPANYVMMYLCSMADPGLIVLPAHRLLIDVPQAAMDGFSELAASFFEIDVFPFSPASYEETKTEFTLELGRRSDANTIGVLIKNRQEFLLLTLKPGVMEERFGNKLETTLRELDVTVLTHLVFMEMLGFDQARLDNDKLIAYSSKASQALDLVCNGLQDMAFLLNPTKIEQVRRISEEGLIMPRKTTYFYPKVITGMVFNSLRKATV